MHDRAVRRLQISSDVRDAINAPEQFRVAFQPLVRLTDWKTVGYEALVRWKHPARRADPARPVHPGSRRDRGHRAPRARGAATARSSGSRCEQRRDPNITMHVNVSVQEIMHGDLPEHVFAAIKPGRRTARNR